jgi:predicted HAD superfamily Cof-like phosphohydrolase
MYYDGSGKFPMGTIQGRHSNCTITKWMVWEKGQLLKEEPWTEIQFDDGKFMKLPHNQMLQFLSSPVVDYMGCLREFHEKFDVPVRNVPTIPPLKDCLRRIRLMEEELSEVITAIDNNNLVEVLDGMVDLLVVAFGTAVEFGLPIDEAFLMVHQEENMTKVWPDGLVHKDAGGKILKPPGHKPADLRRLLLAPEAMLPFGEGGGGQ